MKKVDELLSYERTQTTTIYQKRNKNVRNREILSLNHLSAHELLLITCKREIIASSTSSHTKSRYMIASTIILNHIIKSDTFQKRKFYLKALYI